MSPLKLHNRKTLSLILMGLAFLFISLYSYGRLTDFVAGPTITITSPLPGSSSKSELIQLKGQAKRIATIHLNDRQIFTDDEGHFSEPLLLMPGYNILTLRAEDPFGRLTTKEINLVYLN